MARIVIIGGHGKVALRLSRLLTDEGHEVTSLFRKPEQADDVRQTGAKPVVLDVENSSGSISGPPGRDLSFNWMPSRRAAGEIPSRDR